jgi:glycosyltransferase involved in cell wall biosynthesis
VKVLLLEPYYGGSHRLWADGYIANSQHEITLLALPAQAWKWRMQGGAVTLARFFREQQLKPNLVFASDMMNLATFRALTGTRLADVPHALYFHENQLTYPQNQRQGHGWRYGFINYISAMSANRIFFNSQYHLETFFDTLPDMLKHFYDLNELESISPLRERASVLPLGLNLRKYDAYQTTKSTHHPPLIVWNHRWEVDKNPSAFFRTLDQLVASNVDFRVAILGENVRHDTLDFDSARERLGERIVAFGYVEDFSEYARLLWQADYVVSTSNQEFFGGAVVEAMYCGCVPLLPNRLNYPYLLPASYHGDCMFPHDADLAPLLTRHLRGEIQVDVEALQATVSQYDWSAVAPLYDETLNRLASAPGESLIW